LTTCARPSDWRAGFPATPRGLLLARVALAASDHDAAVGHLDAPSLENLTPRAALVRQILLAAAIERGDPAAAGIVGGVLQTARHEGFLNTVVTTVPQVTRERYLGVKIPPANLKPDFLGQAKVFANRLADDPGTRHHTR
jgi:hypothetical protein